MRFYAAVCGQVRVCTKPFNDLVRVELGFGDYGWNFYTLTELSKDEARKVGVFLRAWQRDVDAAILGDGLDLDGLKFTAGPQLVTAVVNCKDTQGDPDHLAHWMLAPHVVDALIDGLHLAVGKNPSVLQVVDA